MRRIMSTNVLHNADNSVELLLEKLPDLDHDAFKFREIAMDMARVIRISKPPFVYAICGTWGTGKSTLLKFLLDFLSSSSTDEKPNQKSILIYFNAWHASINSNYLAVLVKEIIDQINNSKIIKQSKFKKDLKKLGKSLINAAVKSFAEWNVGGRFIFSFFKSIKMDHTDEFIKNLDATKEVKERFNEISKNLGEKNITAFILIDELDRCSPHIVVKIIEAIRLIFGGHDELYYAAQAINKSTKNDFSSLPPIPFKYILTIDENYVASAFSDYYKIDIDEAHRYFAKFIQMKYHFPAKKWGIFVKNIFDLSQNNEWFCLDNSKEDFSNFLESFNIEASRDAHRILAYLIIWQKRFFDPQAPASIIHLLKSFDHNNEKKKKVLLRAINCILFVFAVIKVRYPSQVSFVLDENFIQKISQPSLDAKKELDQFYEKLLKRRIYPGYIEPTKKIIEALDEIFSDTKDGKYSEDEKKAFYSRLKEIIIEIFNR